ncbi:MAG: N-acetyltransferase [Armatimonadetes bacterium]|nr:N-acetyltransferase [Armatimonadota bacterium]
MNTQSTAANRTQLFIRLERAEDYSAVAAILSAAFGGTAESQLVTALRSHSAVKSLVAVIGKAVVGHIAFSPVTAPVTLGYVPAEISAYGLAPLAVSPEYQSLGIGTELVHAGLKLMEQAGANLIVVLGAPAYYSRFGFRPAALFNLTCKWEDHQDSFQVWSRLPDAAIPQGMVAYLPEFDAF